MIHEYFLKFSLKDKVSTVTGGARGLGNAMAPSLSQAGSNIVIVDLDLETAPQTANAISSGGVRQASGGSFFGLRARPTTTRNSSG